MLDFVYHPVHCSYLCGIHGDSRWHWKGLRAFDDDICTEERLYCRERRGISNHSCETGRAGAPLLAAEDKVHWQLKATTGTVAEHSLQNMQGLRALYCRSTGAGGKLPERSPYHGIEPLKWRLLPSFAHSGLLS